MPWDSNELKCGPQAVVTGARPRTRPAHVWSAVSDAQIAPPTSQNQRSIEDDLLAMGPMLAALPHDVATRRAEHAIRNHDPCISCSTHFLTLAFEPSERR